MCVRVCVRGRGGWVGCEYECVGWGGGGNRV